MFVLRKWRANTIGDRLSRASRYCMRSTAERQPSESSGSSCVRPVGTGHRAEARSYSRAAFAPFKCWNCQTMSETKPSLFCKTCSLIQSTEQQDFDYFELFNVENRYDVDTGQLTSNFRKLQNLVHPDRFSNKTEVIVDHIPIHIGLRFTINIILLCFRKKKHYRNRFLRY